REPFLIKIFFGSNLEKDKMLDMLRLQLGLRRKQLAEYSAISEHINENDLPPELKSHFFYWSLTLKSGIRHGQVWVETLEEAIRDIEKMLTEANDKAETSVNSNDINKVKAGDNTIKKEVDSS
ncbi:MAG: hypothetical protein ACYDEQ_13900, partial [Desulfocucumaceae bacterium]